MSSTPCVLVVADPGRIAELATALGDPFPAGPVDVLVSTGGDDTIDLFESRSPRVVVLTASLELGDAKSLIETLREMVPREELSIVLVGDDTGPIRNALDAIDMKPDRFVSRPLVTKALRFAVQNGMEMVARALGEPVPAASAEGGASATESSSSSAANATSPPVAPAVSRTPTSPLRGATPANGIGVMGAGTSPGIGASNTASAKNGHAANANSSVANGNGSNTEDDGPNVSRAKTDRGTGIRGVPDAEVGAAAVSGGAPGASASMAVGRSPTDRGIGIANATPGLQLEEIPDDASERNKRAALRARWEAIADSITDDDLDDDLTTSPIAVRPATASAPVAPGGGGAQGHGVSSRGLDALGPIDESDDLLRDDLGGGLSDADFGTISDEAAPLPPPIEIAPRRKGSSTNRDFQPVPPVAPWRPGTTSQMRDEDEEVAAPPREPTLILHGDEPPSHPANGGISASLAAIQIAGADTASTASVGGTGPGDGRVGTASGASTGASSGASAGVGGTASGARGTSSGSGGTSGGIASGSGGTSGGIASGETAATGATAATGVTASTGVTPAAAPSSEDGSEQRAPERWSHPVLLSELIDRSRDSSRELLANIGGLDDAEELDEIDDDVIVGHPQHTPPPHAMRGGRLEALENLVEPELPPELASTPAVASRAGAVETRPPDEQPPAGAGERPGGRDFARQLRAKMSMMAQRLFQSDSPAQPSVDVRPRHDHHTEIDLAALGEEPAALGEGVTQIESRARGGADARELTTSPGSWDTQVREKGLPDSGEIVRGVSDAAIVLARMFLQAFTGRVGFRKDDVEKVAYFDQGRPVFASSNEPGDRMGELLVREGKITASQYERCQAHVAQSGRRMGEILVDFGYLKRRELLPAVRRHVEDIIYSLFGWDRGHYHITADPAPSAERIRLSRHPASLILEGVRRKLDRTTLEKVLGPASTVIEVAERERINSVINANDLAQEERASLAAFDGQADLAQVARVTGVDVADVLPLAWGLVVLGLATARRAEADPMEESTALVGETDLAIDRERVRARWQLVTDADYFALLGVRRDATTFEIRRAYQSARRDFAADCFPSDLRRELARELEDIASVLDEAFRVLRDDRLRLTYLSNLLE